MNPRAVGPAPWLAVVETATAGVFFIGDLVMKVKKPLDFGYIDFRDAAARSLACHEEVRLNRRLAPDVYLGVVDLLAPDGDALEHMVVMRRLPAERRLSALLDDQLVARDGLRLLARQLADFHAGAAVMTSHDSPGSYSAVKRLWHDQLVALDLHGSGLLDPELRRRIRVLADLYLAGRKELFDDRLRRGFVREGHGDLLADDIFLLPSGPRVLDCLEFDRRLRSTDVWLDVAFLAMDLERLGAPQLGEQFLQDYREFSGRDAPASLRHFFIAYRAHVRAKVAAIRAGQGDAASAAEARQLAELCLRHLEAGTVTLTLVGGLPGSGKTTLSSALSAELSAVHLSSDVIRRQAYSGEPSEFGRPTPYGQGHYSGSATADIYAELLTRARVALELGESVVLDATWRDDAMRDLARQVAEQRHAVLTEIKCEVSDSTAGAWLSARPPGPSDADEGTRRQMARDFHAWPEATPLDCASADAVSHASGLVRRSVRGHDSPSQ